MSLRNRLMHGLRILFDRRSADRDLSDEMQNYLDEAVAAHVASGLGPEAARRAAQIELGSLTAVHDTVRQSGWESILETIAADLRYAVRQSIRNPGFSLLCILTLALGIGATTAIFSAVYPVLFKPLPYPHASCVVTIWETRDGKFELRPTFGTFHGLAADRTKSFAFTSVMKSWQPALIGSNEPERLQGQRVSADFFRALGVAPAQGRDFQSSDDILNGPRVAIISNRLWQRRFASDPAIVGRQLLLDDDLYVVIGVMPSSFENILEPSAEIWAPLGYDASLPADGKEWGHHLRMIGRLRDGVAPHQAADELTVQLKAFAPLFSTGYESSGGAPQGILVNPLQDDVSRAVKPALLAILGAVFLVLLIASINVTNLVLARGAERRGEFALRSALGAGRTRMIRQLLAESLLIAAAGGALGLAFAAFGIRAIVAMSPPDLPRTGDVRIDAVALAFAIVVTTFVGICVGLLPALHASANDPQSSLHQSSRGTVKGHLLTRRILVVAEISISLVLLVSAGLLFRSIHRIFSVDPGFNSSRVLTLQVDSTGHRFDDDAVRARFFAQALDAVRGVPGVASAAFTSQMPLSGDSDVYGIEFASVSSNNNEAAFRYAVSPSYFQTMQIPLRLGRYLDERDTVSAPVAVVLSESFARRIFTHEDPIGQRVRLGPDAGRADRPWSTIVGVVGDVKQDSLAIDDSDAFYTTNTQWAWGDSQMSFVVRARTDPASLTPEIKQAIWSIDKDQPIVRVASMPAIVASSEAQRRFALILFEAFGFVALFLAATGIYAVLSGGVNERTREIGLRAAFGASPRHILSLILGQGMRLVVFGIAIGIVGVTIASQLLATLLFGITRLDPVTYLGVIALLIAVAAAACWFPARRAMRLDPMVALRHD